MTPASRNNVDYRLLGALSDLLICSRCFRSGVVTRVPQIISSRHKIKNVCATCRSQLSNRHPSTKKRHRSRFARLLSFKQ